MASGCVVVEQLVAFDGLSACMDSAREENRERAEKALQDGSKARAHSSALLWINTARSDDRV